MTSLNAANTEPAGGDAKTDPQTAPVIPPLPTSPAAKGSWPEPPPETIATFSFDQSDLTTTLLINILGKVQKSSREPLSKI